MTHQCYTCYMYMYMHRCCANRQVYPARSALQIFMYCKYTKLSHWLIVLVTESSTP